MSYIEFDEMSQSPWNKAMYDDIINTFLNRCKSVKEGFSIKEDFKVLDLGSGPGGLSLAMLRRVQLGEIHLLDLRNDGLVKAKQRINNEHPNTKVHIIKADVHNIPSKENTYDLIISRGSMQFWENQKNALKETRRILKAGGIAYMGGGKGSVEFQQRRLKEDKDWSNDNFNKDNLRKRIISSNKLQNSEYEDLFKSQGDRYNIYNHLGDGRWMIWKKQNKL